ncbi:MAG: tetratricopeptide repeat protein [Bacteroidetes bacterium]|nr:tetratricopeptide repeat protein [Bacteroidota bacterium]
MLSASSLHAQNGSLQKAFQESYELEEQGEYTQAISKVKNVYLETSYEANLRLGWLHYSAGLFTDAMAYYQKCMDLYPMSIEAKFGYALPASALGHWDKVLTQYQSILKIDHQNTKANYYAGQIYYGRLDYGTAEKYFEKVVNLYPFDYDSLLMLGWTKYFLGKSSEAKVLFKKVLLYDPADESAKEGLSLLK